MIDKGANPFIVSYGGKTWADETRNLSNLPTKKSIFFTTQPFPMSSKEKTTFLTLGFIERVFLMVNFALSLVKDPLEWFSAVNGVERRPLSSSLRLALKTSKNILERL